MKLNLTRLALDNRVTTSVALIAVIFAGISAYNKMARDEDPGFIIRFAQIITHYPGANPERMELLITDKIEKVVQEMPELKEVTSISRTGISIVIVQIKAEHRELRPIWDSLRRKIDKVRPQLPQGVIGPNVNDEFGDVFGIVAALTGEGYSYAGLKEVADQIRDELLLLPDVAKVEIHGAQTERVFVEYSNAKLAQLGLSIYQLLDILQKRNIINPGGYLDTGDERIALEPSGNFESLEEIKRTVVGIPGRKDVVHLEDIVTIRRGYIEPPEQRMRYNSQPALGLAVSMRAGGNLIELGKQVRPLLEKLESSYPWGIDLSLLAFQPDVVDQKVDEFAMSLLQAVGIVMVVMLLFLGLRTGFLVASLIPSAILLAFMVMGLFGIGLDQMSLASLIIALGLLVDNAIVMAESIMVQMQRGKKAVEAAVSSASELRVPLLVSSLTTAAAFLPIFLAESDVGEYTAPLFKVVTIALLSSWTLALTMTPLLCVYFMKIKKKQQDRDPTDTRFYRAYRGLLLRVLRRPLISVGCIVLVFVGVMSLAGRVPAIFFPDKIEPVFVGDLKLPGGTPIARTEEVVKRIEQYIQSNAKDKVKDWTTYIGSGGPKFKLAYNPRVSDSSYAMMLLNTTSSAPVLGLIDELNTFCKRTFPDLQANFRKMAYGPPVTNPVEIKITGRTRAEVFDKADRIKARLRQIKGTRNIDDDWGQQAKKLVVRVSQARALRAGVTNQDIALSLQTIFSGFENTSFREQDKVIPISLRSAAADRKDIGKLETLNVYSQRTGRSVPLKQVANVEVQWTPGKILRKNRLKSMVVSAQLEPGFLASQIVQELLPWLEKESAAWEIGTKYEIGGSDKAAEEGNQSIAEKLPIAGMLILLLLVAQFNGVRKPLIILSTIPLALIGVVLGLLLTGSYFGFMTFLGVISLAGIVINNAIVLLDRIRIEIEEHGLSPQEAVVTAAQLRLRPILLTTVTTIGGLLPLWLGGGPMWEPMAIAIIFGLLFSTVLTLGFVPLLYSLLFRVRFKGFSGLI